MASITLKDITKPVQTELKLFQKKFKANMKTEVPLLDKITYYIVQKKGKQMRPLFVLLCAKICGEVNEGTYRSASFVELIHTASLVHDDVVDDADMRRGFFSVNALWKNKVAVLVGDFLLAKGLLISLDSDEYKLLQLVAKSVKAMSEGELLQIEKARRLDITEDVYFEIIRQKTASLIAASCASGCSSVSNDQDMVNQFWTLGEYIGIAFQIKDDLLDYGTGDIGKPKGIDLKERKLTLPLIHALQNSTATEKSKIINLVKRSGNTPEAITTVYQFVMEKGGIAYAQNRMQAYRDKALDLLQAIPYSNASKDSLVQLIEYVTSRQK